VTILTRAVAGLTRSTQSTPDDGELTALLATARTLLWQTWEQIALARLAAAMPWNGDSIATIGKEARHGFAGALRTSGGLGAGPRCD
jgi:hypothetical protein